MSQPLTPGSQIGRYRLEGEIGRGGMGVVYRAVDPSLNRPVALKLLAAHLGSDPNALTRFHREAALVAGLKHPHIAIVYEFGEHLGQPFIAFEWIEGQTLKDVLTLSGRLPFERASKLFDQLASALDYAHQRGVIHRDLKPANIMIGPQDHATIVDFGLGWLEDAPSITSTGLILGTPRYMAPEQIEGKVTDARADLYSLAVVMYETLAGPPPFQNFNTPALLQQQLYAPPPAITEYNPALPPTLYAGEDKILVFVSTDDSQLYALNYDEARLVWRIGANSLNGAVTGGLVVEYGALYALTDAGWLYVFGAENGDGYWSLDLSQEDTFTQPPLVTNVGLILVGEKEVYAIDPASQEIVWQAETSGQITTPPVTTPGGSSMFVGTNEGAVQAFSILSGKEIWQAKTSSPVVGLAADWSRLTATTEDGNVYGWYNWNGEQSWLFESGSALAAAPVTTGSDIFFGTSDGAVRVLNAESGEELPDRTLTLDAALSHAPVLIGGWLFVQTQGEIYAFGP
jgi:serine/threonine-protein kinase